MAANADDLQLVPRTVSPANFILRMSSIMYQGLSAQQQTRLFQSLVKEVDLSEGRFPSEITVVNLNTREGFSAKPDQKEPSPHRMPSSFLSGLGFFQMAALAGKGM